MRIKSHFIQAELFALSKISTLAKLITALAMVVLPMASLAAIDQPARNLKEWYGLSPETNSRVATVRVVAADYDLLARDFPKYQRQANESVSAWHSRVDQELIRETGFIHVLQTLDNDVNTRIQITEDHKRSYRPAGYRRAHIIEVDGGFMDAKGVGSEFPEQRHHANGLATLGEMLREFIYEKAVEKIFAAEDSRLKTVGSYAVLDYGFDVIHKDGTRDRAGYILRQAHQRSQGTNSSLPAGSAATVELTLRKYGITGSGETFSQREKFTSDYLNIQGTNSPDKSEVVDFGAFLAVEGFAHEVKDATMKHVVIPQQEVKAAQPDPQLRVPLEQWGAIGKNDPKSDKPWIWSHELAKAWAEGRADRSAVNQHLKNFLEPLDQRLKSARRSCESVFFVD